MSFSALILKLRPSALQCILHESLGVYNATKEWIILKWFILTIHIESNNNMFATWKIIGHELPVMMSAMMYHTLYKFTKCYDYGSWLAP